MVLRSWLRRPTGGCDEAHRRDHIGGWLHRRPASGSPAVQRTYHPGSRKVTGTALLHDGKAQILPVLLQSNEERKRAWRRSQVRSDSKESLSSSSDTARAAASDTASRSTRPVSAATRACTSERLSQTVRRLLTRSCIIRRIFCTIALVRSLECRCTAQRIKPWSQIRKIIAMPSSPRDISLTVTMMAMSTPTIVMNSSKCSAKAARSGYNLEEKRLIRASGS